VKKQQGVLPFPTGPHTSLGNALAVVENFKLFKEGVYEKMAVLALGWILKTSLSPSGT